jgi:hypothetical protein
MLTLVSLHLSLSHCYSTWERREDDLPMEAQAIVYKASARRSWFSARAASAVNSFMPRDSSNAC